MTTDRDYNSPEKFLVLVERANERYNEELQDCRYRQYTSVVVRFMDRISVVVDKIAPKLLLESTFSSSLDRIDFQLNSILGNELDSVEMHVQYLLYYNAVAPVIVKASDVEWDAAQHLGC